MKGVKKSMIHKQVLRKCIFSEENTSRITFANQKMTYDLSTLKLFLTDQNTWLSQNIPKFRQKIMK